MVPPQLAWTWIQRRQDEQTLSSQRQPAQAQAGAVPHPPHHPPPHPGHSRSPNRQLITAWRPGGVGSPSPLLSQVCNGNGTKTDSSAQRDPGPFSRGWSPGSQKGGGDTGVSLLKQGASPHPSPAPGSWPQSSQTPAQNGPFLAA